MKTVIKVVVSLLFIAALVATYGSGELIILITSISYVDVVVLTLLCSISLMILAKRFQLVLAAEQITEKWAAVFSLQLMGLSLSQFMPGLYGGDLLRAAYFMPHYRQQKKFLTASVIFERLNGLLAMFLLGIISTIYVGITQQQTEWLLAAGFLGCLLVFFCSCAVFVHFYWKEKSSLFRWLRLSQEIVDILAKLFARRLVFCRTLLLSTVSQMISISAYYYLARIFQADLTLSAVACAVTLAWLVTVVPVSLNGLGLREGGLVIVMLSFGAPQAAALSVSLVALLPTLIHAILGCILIVLNFRSVIGLKKLLKA